MLRTYLRVNCRCKNSAKTMNSDCIEIISEALDHWRILQNLSPKRVNNSNHDIIKCRIGSANYVKILNTCKP